jgi:HlyD family secretion protein
MTVGADSSEDQQQSQQTQGQGSNKDKPTASMIYKALVSLGSQELQVDKQQFKLVPGMQVTAEINQGKRTVLEYLLSPLEKTVRESGRER